ncbi:2639_t:CDS:2 [Diversispora eburnea]|uniref:2639_t:CDS:1 n=1 Tax=Diversispora eburnea TaxID=1213867 RepID=A0A9N8ZB71_9GLOM|nr:2639_t:CDS:2 [Diversispora eburnea]
MSLPDEALRKILFELQNRLVENTRQLNTVKSQVQLKEREKRLAEITKRELSSLENDTRTYKSVDIRDLTNELSNRVSKIDTDLITLDKSRKYLERNIDESSNGLREIVGARP